MQTLADLSPTTYFQGGLAIDGLNWTWLLGLLGCSVLFALIGWWRFRGRDVRVAGEGGWRLAGMLRRRKADEVVKPAPSIA